MFSQNYSFCEEVKVQPRNEEVLPRYKGLARKKKSFAEN